MVVPRGRKWGHGRRGFPRWLVTEGRSVAAPPPGPWPLRLFQGLGLQGWGWGLPLLTHTPGMLQPHRRPRAAPASVSGSPSSEPGPGSDHSLLLADSLLLTSLRALGPGEALGWRHWGSWWGAQQVRRPPVFTHPGMLARCCAPRPTGSGVLGRALPLLSCVAWGCWGECER